MDTRPSKANSPVPSPFAAHAPLADEDRLLRDVRDRLLATPDTVCLERARLVTEAYRAYESLPVPECRARALEHVLRHMTLDLDSNPFFAGNTSSRTHAWMLLPEYGIGMDGQVLLENPGLAGLLDNAVPRDILDYWQSRNVRSLSGIGHLAVDLPRVVDEGLEAVALEAESLAGVGDEAQRGYRRAMALACRAVIAWATRYADAADRAATVTPDPLRRALHRRVAEACRRVPAQPARDLFEGLQAIILVHTAIAIEGHGMSVSVGSPDRVLARFAPEADDPATVALLGAFMLTFTANSLFGRGYKSLTITVGGSDHTGRDRCNRLTERFLEACDRLRVGDPPLFLRWHAGLDRRVWARALDMLARGVSMPLLVHDAPTAAGFIAAGVPAADAYEYAVIGCNELAIPGRAWHTARGLGGMNHLEAVNAALLDPALSDPPPADADSLFARLEPAIRDRVVTACRYAQDRACLLAERVPTPFTSALMRGNVAEGRDLHVWQPFALEGFFERGLTNAANALAAIGATVFHESRLPWGELIAALRADFPDAPLRQRLRAAPKWGNDDPRADRWAIRLLEARERALRHAESTFGQPRHLPCHVVRSLHHLDGKRIAASPDGRLAGAAVADSIGAETGTARRGPTALLNSVLKIESPRFYGGGYNLNLTLLAADTRPDTLDALITGFFRAGGQELQVNVLDAATLRDAQRSPARYPDLVVRVAGLSARFVDLPTVEQDELIQRAESAHTA